MGDQPTQEKHDLRYDVNGSSNYRLVIGEHYIDNTMNIYLALDAYCKFDYLYNYIELVDIDMPAIIIKIKLIIVLVYFIIEDYAIIVQCSLPEIQ